MRFLFVLFCLIFNKICAFDQTDPKDPPSSNHFLAIDFYRSPDSGAKNILTTYYLFDTVLKKCFPSREATLKNSAALRCLDWFLVQLPIAELMTTIQHEIYGHGFAIRSTPDDQIQLMGYRINLPLPYGMGGGGTRYFSSPTIYTIYNKINMIAAGLNAENVLRNQLKLDWLRCNAIVSKQAYLYFILTLSGIVITNEKDRERDDHWKYVKAVNLSQKPNALTLERLQNLSCINFCDPMFFYSFYSLGRYFTTGKEGPIPMIPLKSLKWLPNLRIGLSPFGPEIYFENFFVQANTPFCFYLRRGSTNHQVSQGFGFSHDNLFQGWGLQMHGWLQPHNAFNDTKYALDNFKEETKTFSLWGEGKTVPAESPIPPKAEYPIGGALLISKQAQTNPFYIQFGAKTSGYLEGFPLQECLFIQLGVNIL